MVAPLWEAPKEESQMQTWQDGEEWHIDVRGLPPPQPLVKILQLVHAVGPASIVIVHHDRDPKMLYPELAQIGWQAEPIEGDSGEVRLRLSPLRE